MKKLISVILITLILTSCLPASAENIIKYDGVTIFELFCRYQKRLEDFGYKYMFEPLYYGDVSLGPGGMVDFDGLNVLAFDSSTYSVLQCGHSIKKDSENDEDYYRLAIFESSLRISLTGEDAEKILNESYKYTARETLQRMYNSNESKPYECGDYYVIPLEDEKYYHFSAYRKDYYKTIFD